MQGFQILGSGSVWLCSRCGKRHAAGAQAVGARQHKTSLDGLPATRATAQVAAAKLTHYQILIVVAAAMTLFPRLSLGQGVADYPTRPVRVIVASGPGSTSDIVGRLVAGKLSESLKRQFVVDNRPGGGSTTGSMLAAKSAPDGYTLLAAAPPFAFAPALRPDLPYDPVKDFAPISLVTKAPLLLVVHPALPDK